jgi:hypothetical protein
LTTTPKAKAGRAEHALQSFAKIHLTGKSFMKETHGPADTQQV